jgi:hydroxyethylthiazole kinase-like uncharacterized protein yjeF
MKPVLTPEQAAQLDRLTQERGATSAELMERAGRAVARSAVDLLGGVYGRRAVVVCGKGNNGGDGLVAARYLAEWGMRVAVVALASIDHEPARSNFGRLDETGLRARGFDRPALERELARADIVIDAIFGTGFRGVPGNEWEEAIGAINACEAPVVAVDIPSGVDGATGAVEGEAVWAELTVTFGAAKTGAILMPGAERTGQLRVVDIGFAQGALDVDVFLTEPSDVAELLPVRGADTHKRASGVLLVVAGSRQMTGAPHLIAKGAARMGTGLVTIAAPASALAPIQAESIETTFMPLAETADGNLAEAAVAQVVERLGSVDALALGPGLGQSAETAAAVRLLVRRCTVPLALDADGLNAFAGRASHLADRDCEMVLTPHAGELRRLIGVEPRDLEAARIEHARKLAAESRAIALIKGSRTVIAEPEGRVVVNLTGSSVLATAGSGDVLTGVIGGLLARGVRAQAAAWAGAYVHGVAGTIAGGRTGEGTLAGDVAEALPAAVARVREG